LMSGFASALITGVGSCLSNASSCMFTCGSFWWSEYVTFWVGVYYRGITCILRLHRVI
jgi:hypothetical protein